MKPSCEKCRFFQPSAFAHHGACRAAIPAAAGVTYGGVGWEAVWPVVHLNDWCGSFKRRTAK